MDFPLGNECWVMQAFVVDGEKTSVPKHVQVESVMLRHPRGDASRLQLYVQSSFQGSQGYLRWENGVVGLVLQFMNGSTKHAQATYCSIVTHKYR